MMMETSLQRTELHYSHHVRFPTIKYLPGRLPAEGARYVIFLLRWSPIKIRLCKFQSIVALKRSGVFRSVPFEVDISDPDEASNVTNRDEEKKSEREFHSSFQNIYILLLVMKPENVIVLFYSPSMSAHRDE